MSAKPAKISADDLIIPVPQDTEGADLAMKRMVALTNQIEHQEKHYEDRILALRAELVRATAPLKDELKGWEKALAQFARKERKTLFVFAKTIMLNFGKFGFRWGKPRIKRLTAEETIVERLKAKGRRDLIRITEAPNYERLVNYENDFLEPLGCRRIQTERFFYELKREEIALSETRPAEVK